MENIPLLPSMSGPPVFPGGRDILSPVSATTPVTPTTPTPTAHSYYVSQRVSFKSVIGTVRYIGPIEGTENEWLGIEWDDPSRGKHDGSYMGKRYFKCQSPSLTAATFIRTTRSKDPDSNFYDAVHEKYAAPLEPVSAKPTVISGKVAEEVGFDKIREQQARLDELKIVIVDGMRIKKRALFIVADSVRDEFPNIVELDMSRNLFETFKEVYKIIGHLMFLRRLRLNGNRFQDGRDWSSDIIRRLYRGADLSGIEELELDNTLVPWEGITSKVSRLFPGLKSLSVSSNYFTSLSNPLMDGITTLTLEYNQFTMIWDIIILRQLDSLQNLKLKGNRISSVDKPGIPLTSFHAFGTRLRYVDLSYNAIDSWRFVDDLPQIFPGLEELRLSHNPIYEGLPNDIVATVEEGYTLTLARLGNLQSLNFSKITPADRIDAEMFYLSKIAKEMGKVQESEEHVVTSRHKRYSELCKKYGPPAVVRSHEGVINPNFLEARLIKFTFYLPSKVPAEEEEATTNLRKTRISADVNSSLKMQGGKREAIPEAGEVAKSFVLHQPLAKQSTATEAITKVRELPKSFDVYRVKGIVGKMYDLSPLKIRLIWETGEWDPVAGYEDLEENSDDEEDVAEAKTTNANAAAAQKNGMWKKREEELKDGTREVGNKIDGLEATVRIEMR